jgi:hypothetical protein
VWGHNRSNRRDIEYLVFEGAGTKIWSCSSLPIVEWSGISLRPGVSGPKICLMVSIISWISPYPGRNTRTDADSRGSGYSSRYYLFSSNRRKEAHLVCTKKMIDTLLLWDYNKADTFVCRSLVRFHSDVQDI